MCKHFAEEHEDAQAAKSTTAENSKFPDAVGRDAIKKHKMCNRKESIKQTKT